MPKLKIAKFSEVCGVDLRSLAVFRVGLSLIVIEDIISRLRGVTAHYSDAGVLPRSVLKALVQPGHWSVHALSGSTVVEGFLFLFALVVALFMLVGYRTRIATIITWALFISVQNRNPLLIFAGDHVLRAVLFWAMFFPLGAYYSIDNALNSSSKPLPKWVFSGATVAFMLQLSYVYIWSAAFKTKSTMWWPDGEAVYYALNFDQYVTSFGRFLLNLPPDLLKGFNNFTLVFEWLGPLMIFIPFYNNFWRILGIISFSLLHIGFGLSFNIGTLSYLSIFNWLALTPSFVWDKWSQKLETPERQGLTIYYDSDCGFCKKMVHLIRTFLILPASTPLLKAQEDEGIYAAMLEQNSWVVKDYLGEHHYKFEGIIYVCRLSPVLRWIVPILSLQPVKNVGTKFYELIASNRRAAGLFTRPLKFRPLEVNSSWVLNAIAIFFFLIATVWNLKGFVDQTVNRRQEQPNDWVSQVHKLLSRRIVHRIAWIPEATRLDQIWSIFAPNAPGDDGWYVIVGKLKDGTEVNVFRENQPIIWDKPTVKQRDDFYQTIQWRVFFIELHRGMGKAVYPHFAQYLCEQWNKTHSGDQQLESLTVYFIDERTVPPNEKQTTKTVRLIDKTCF